MFLQSALELQPLVEAEEREWWEGGEEEGGVDTSPLRAPTMVVEDTPLPPSPLPDTPPPAVTGFGATGQRTSMGDRRVSSGIRNHRVSFGPQVHTEDLDVSTRKLQCTVQWEILAGAKFSHSS